MKYCIKGNPSKGKCYDESNIIVNKKYTILFIKFKKNIDIPECVKDGFIKLKEIEYILGLILNYKDEDIYIDLLQCLLDNLTYCCSWDIKDRISNKLGDCITNNNIEIFEVIMTSRVGSRIDTSFGCRLFKNPIDDRFFKIIIEKKIRLIDLLFYSATNKRYDIFEMIFETTDLVVNYRSGLISDLIKENDIQLLKLLFKYKNRITGFDIYFINSMPNNINTEIIQLIFDNNIELSCLSFLTLLQKSSPEDYDMIINRGTQLDDHNKRNIINYLLTQAYNRDITKNIFKKLLDTWNYDIYTQITEDKTIFSYLDELSPSLMFITDILLSYNPVILNIRKFFELGVRRNNPALIKYLFENYKSDVMKLQTKECKYMKYCKFFNDITQIFVDYQFELSRKFISYSPSIRIYYHNKDVRSIKLHQLLWLNSHKSLTFRRDPYYESWIRKTNSSLPIIQTVKKIYKAYDKLEQIV